MSEDAATPAVHSSARDASQRWDSTWSGGDTGSHESMWEVTTVSLAHTVGTNTADAEFDKQSRIIVLYVEVILGAIGGIGVFLWLWHNRRSKSRVNALILHLALSDWLVVLLACLPQLIWEYDRQWRASNAFCKVFKFIQSFAMMASNNMVVVLSIDRHQAIRSPLREAFPVWKLTGVGWTLAGLLSLPQFAVFHVNERVEHAGIFHGMRVCESMFRLHPEYRGVYLVFIGVVVFYIPLLLLALCYIRIFCKIAQKAKESTQQRYSLKPGKVHLQSTTSSSLPKAKAKTLKMTLVIVSTFILCSAPYQILEMINSFGNHKSVPPIVASIFGGMAVANSVTNPYVFLLFNASVLCCRGLLGRICPSLAVAVPPRGAGFDSTASTRTEYSLNSSYAGHSRVHAAKYIPVSSTYNKKHEKVTIITPNRTE